MSSKKSKFFYVDLLSVSRGRNSRVIQEPKVSGIGALCSDDSGAPWPHGFTKYESDTVMIEHLFSPSVLIM